jgi:hypothetical protein
MTDAELETAMTLGAKSPLDERAADDLGRFGMGLKTASFSQCRRLTVASKCVRRGDLMPALGPRHAGIVRRRLEHARGAG